MWSLDLQHFQNTDSMIHENLQKYFQNYMKIYREMVFKNCKVQEIVSF